MNPIRFLMLFLLAGGGEDDRAAILGGVERLERHGVPGTLVVFGDEAFPVITANDPPEAMAAAARFGKGRVVAVAHGAYLEPGTLARKESGAARLFSGALRWAADQDGPLAVGILGADGGLADLLSAEGHIVRPGLDVDVLIWRSGGEEASEQQAIREFVAAGGGLISAVCPWGYEQVNERRGRTLREHLPENRVLAPMGLVFAPGYAEPTQGGGFAADHPLDVHAGRALDRLLAGEEGAERGAYLLERALFALPADDPILRPRLLEALAAPRIQALERLSIIERSRAWKERPPEEVEKADGVDEFPGAVPEDAPRVTRALSFGAAVRGWQGTGLYLPAGEVLQVSADEVDGWSIQIGCHTDRLFHLAEWERWPEITCRVALRPGMTRVATPFGGPIYLEADGADRAVLEIELSGAVEAPRFVLQDPESRGQWNARRGAPAPWAELEGQHVILSVPSAAIRALADPAPVLQWWDGVVASHCALAGCALPARRERIVPDRQISAGYMHAGYPIMTHLDVATAKGGLPPLLDLETLRSEGNWGLLHELGHNRQKGDWTFAGTGEVTCNLFSLYSSETMAGIEPWTHPWLEGQKQAGLVHLEKGAPYEEWKRHPGVALLMYAQLQKRFGWTPFQRVFAAYEALDDAERPRTDQERIDQWMTRMSRACGRDLRPFFRAWGLPLGEAAALDRELGRLPEWLPDFDELRS